MRNQKKAYGGLMLITALWGVSFPVMDACLTRMGPFTFVALRYLGAAIVLSFLCVKHGMQKGTGVFKDGILVGIPYAAAAVFQMIGLGQTSVANASFITGLTVVFVPLIVWLFERIVPSGSTLTGIVISLIGVAVMTKAWNLDINKGDLWVLLSAIAFSLQIYHLEKYGKEKEPLSLTCVVLWTVTVLTLPAAIGKEKLVLQMDWKLAAALFFVSVICTAWAIFAQNLFQPQVPASKAAVIYLLEPVTATAFSLILGERIGMFQIIGGIFILSGAWTIISCGSGKHNSDGRYDGNEI